VPVLSTTANKQCNCFLTVFSVHETYFAIFYPFSRRLHVEKFHKSKTSRISLNFKQKQFHKLPAFRLQSSSDSHHVHTFSCFHNPYVFVGQLCDGQDFMNLNKKPVWIFPKYIHKKQSYHNVLLLYIYIHFMLRIKCMSEIFLKHLLRFSYSSLLYTVQISNFTNHNRI
jgi:hypothetical protein